MNYNGFEIIENPYLPATTPVIELSPNLMVSDEFRRKTNKYYLERFGLKTVSYIIGNKIIMNPENIAKLVVACS